MLARQQLRLFKLLFSTPSFSCARLMQRTEAAQGYHYGKGDVVAYPACRWPLLAPCPQQSLLHCILRHAFGFRGLSQSIWARTRSVRMLQQTTVWASPSSAPSLTSLLSTCPRPTPQVGRCDKLPASLLPNSWSWPYLCLRLPAS